MSSSAGSSAPRRVPPQTTPVKVRDQFHGGGSDLPFVQQVLVGVGAIAVAVLARIAIEQVVGGVAPFALTFPMVMLATLFAGPTAGLVAAIGCQALTIRYVLPHWMLAHGGPPTSVANLILSTLSLALMIWATSSYRRVSAKLRGRCEREVETLSLLIGEIDHRTKNNFQIAAALLSDQARTVGHGVVAVELLRASTRLGSIASVYRNLALASRGADDLPLADYLEDVTTLLRAGFIRPGVDLSLRCDPVSVDPRTAMMMGLIANEWITNAVKYAFPDDTGRIALDVRRDGADLVMVVEDDGMSFAERRAPGAGSRLIDGLARAVHGTVEVVHSHGTRCTLRVPPDKLR